MGLSDMHLERHSFRRALRSTALYGISALLLCPLAAHAFNPDDGAETPIVSRNHSNLPSTAALQPKSIAPVTSAGSPLPAVLPATTPLFAPMPKLVFTPLPADRQVPAENKSTPQVPVENQAAMAATVLPQPTSAPQFPPVDASTVARANAELAKAQPNLPASVIAAPPTFVAPAPLITADASVKQAVIADASAKQPMPAALPEPVGNPQPAATAAPEQLSNASRSVLSKIPSKLNTEKPAPAKGKNDKLAVNRMSPQIKSLVVSEQKVESFDSAGLSIKVQRPGLDTNFELNRAYTALMGGDNDLAITTYKNILSGEAGNEDALFGLASTYHRLGEIEKARPYYAQLLKVNPNHRDGLNNFLALVSDEAPQDALAELERLEQRNPDFSPIPAQEALVLSKLGYTDQAREKILRAIELSPDNLTYKYNLAIMLDRQGNYVDASALYRMLIDASLNGEKIPAPNATIQKRLNYIATAGAPQPTTGG